MIHISQLAERSGVPASTLRYYGSVGLLPAVRDPAGHRFYDANAIERLTFIGIAKRFGLPLNEIRDLVTAVDSGTAPETAADLRGRLVTYLGEAERRFAELTSFMTSLRTTLQHLETAHDEPA